MPRRAQCQENQYVSPSQNQSLLSSSLLSDKSFVCCVKSKQTERVSHECKLFHYLFYVIHETLLLLCLDSMPRTQLACLIPETFFHFRRVFYFSESDLIAHIVLSVKEARKGYTAQWKAISFTGSRGERERVPEARCRMDSGKQIALPVLLLRMHWWGGPGHAEGWLPGCLLTDFLPMISHYSFAYSSYRISIVAGTSPSGSITCCSLIHWALSVLTPS